MLAGHSAGGQLVQRYAIVGRAPDAVGSPSLKVRFVVANPSSYLYFSPERPKGDGFAAFDAALCPNVNRWNYGVEAPPPYVTGPVADLEGHFIARDVTYELGLLDVDPNHPVSINRVPARRRGRTVWRADSPTRLVWNCVIRAARTSRWLKSRASIATRSECSPQAARAPAVARPGAAGSN